MSDDLSTADLLTKAATGSTQAWDALVDRYAPLIWSICRTYRLGDADADRVGLAVWSQLASQLGTTCDPTTLAGWLAAAAARECGQIREPQAAGLPPDAGSVPDKQSEPAEQELRAAAREAALHEALTRLPGCCQQLITMLAEDPPAPNGQISATLGIPVDTIGPIRRRCLDKLRRDPDIAALINSAPD
jgi:DNA-directed RNA polymerase specialized sigma24 family protein